MGLRPPGHIDAQALAADETIVLDLTDRRDLRALPDTIGLVTSLQSLCLAGALASQCCHESTLEFVLLTCRTATPVHRVLCGLHRMRDHGLAAGLARTALKPA